MKKFIPRRYVLLYLCENYIFLAFICYVDHFINQKISKDITNWIWPGHAIFAISKTALNSRKTLLHNLYHNFRAFCRENSNQTKRRMMALSYPPFFLRVSRGKIGCSQVKNSI